MDHSAPLPDDVLAALNEVAATRLSLITDQLGQLAAALALPVKVRQQSPSGWQPDYLASVGTTPVELAGPDPTRASITINNLSSNPADVLWCGPDPNLVESAAQGGTPVGCFPIYGGTALTLTITGRVEVASPNNVPVGWHVLTWQGEVAR